MDNFLEMLLMAFFALGIIFALITIFDFVMSMIETRRKVDYLIKKDKKNVP